MINGSAGLSAAAQNEGGCRPKDRPRSLHHPPIARENASLLDQKGFRPSSALPLKTAFKRSEVNFSLLKPNWA